MSNETDTLGESAPTTRLWVTTTKLPKRDRAGLRFMRGTYREVEIIELTAAEITKRQSAGESVVNAAGAQAIIEDASLEFRHSPPPPPRVLVPAGLPSVVGAAVVAWWLKLAAVLGLTLPRQREPALIALRAAIDRTIRKGSDRMLIAIWHRIDQLLESVVDGLDIVSGIDEINGLIFAVGADVPPPLALPPVTVRRWVSNETPPPWMTTCAELIGERFPARFLNEPFAAELAPMIERVALAQQKSPPDADAASWIPEFERLIRQARERQRLAVAAWSESVDIVRRRCLAAIDHALADTSAGPLVRFALHYLGRAGRGLATTQAIGPDDALGAVIGLAQIERQPDPPSDPAPLITVRVRTKALPSRRRAGFRFTLGQSEIMITAAQLAELRADDALDVVDDVPASAALAAARTRSELLVAEEASLRAELEQLKIAAARRNAPPDSGDGSSSRLKAAAKARLKAPVDSDPDDSEFGGGQ